MIQAATSVAILAQDLNTRMLIVIVCIRFVFGNFEGVELAEEENLTYRYPAACPGQFVVRRFRFELEFPLS